MGYAKSDDQQDFKLLDQMWFILQATHESEENITLGTLKKLLIALSKLGDS
jgi:hypothetical protein